MMAFCPEHPKWDQNPKFTPLSETTSIPTPFIYGVPPPGDRSVLKITFKILHNITLLFCHSFQVIMILYQFELALTPPPLFFSLRTPRNFPGAYLRKCMMRNYLPSDQCFCVFTSVLSHKFIKPKFTKALMISHYYIAVRWMITLRKVRAYFRLSGLWYIKEALARFLTMLT